MPSISSFSRLIVRSPKICLAIKSFICIVAAISLILTCISFVNARSITANTFTLCLILLSTLDIMLRMVCGANSTNQKCSKLIQSMKDPTIILDCILLLTLTIALFMKTCIKFDDAQNGELSHQQVFICACQVVILGALLATQCMGLASSICSIIDNTQSKLHNIDHRQYEIKQPSQMAPKPQFIINAPQHRSPNRKQANMFNEGNDSESKYQYFLEEASDGNDEHQMRETERKQKQSDGEAVQHNESEGVPKLKQQQVGHQI